MVIMPLRTPLSVDLELYEYEHVVEKDKGAQRAGTERRPKAFGWVLSLRFIGPPGDFG